MDLEIKYFSLSGYKTTITKLYDIKWFTSWGSKIDSWNRISTGQEMVKVCANSFYLIIYFPNAEFIPSWFHNAIPWINELNELEKEQNDNIRNQ